MSVVLYHLAEQAAWEAARVSGRYEPSSLASEGFVHCSTAEQYARVANERYAGRRDLVLMFVDPSRLTVPVRIENGYPHVYGPIDLDAVFEVDAFTPDEDGSFHEHHETPGFEIFGALSLDDVVARATSVMGGFDPPWWIAGGWACDLFLERRTRPHADLEISVLRRDLPILFEHLDGWQRAVADRGRLLPWSSSTMAAEHHQVWARRGQGPLEVPVFVGDPSFVGFLVEETVDDTWSYRRVPSITRPLEAFSASARGAPIVAPDVVALYKSRGSRWKDQRDLDALLPALSDEQRAWLSDAVIQHRNDPR